jgi:hypothetical protein
VKTGQDFAPVEVLAAAILLDDQGEGFLHALIGGEPPQAMGAFPPAADHVPFLAQSRVDDPIIRVLAEWAAQSLVLPSRFDQSRQWVSIPQAGFSFKDAFCGQKGGEKDWPKDFKVTWKARET